MKRVLFVSPTGGYAGIDVCLETLVLGLDRTRFEPVVVFPLNAFLKQRFEKEGIRCYELPLNWWFPVEFTGSDLLRVLPTLRSKVDPLVQIIRSERIDVVLSNTTVALDGAIAAGICKVNFATDLCYAFLDCIAAKIDTRPALDVFMKDPINAVKAFAEDRIRLVGAEGIARK